METNEDEISSLRVGVPDKLKKLSEELDKCKSERKEYLDGWQRERAESINASKETLVKLNREFERGRDSVIHKFLPVLDSFDLALAESGALSSSGDAWKEGMERIHSQAINVLKDVGVVVLKPTGEQFNPHEHEAIGEINIKKRSQEGRVMETVQCGYKMGSSLIRPAKVKIGKFIDNK